MNPLETIREKTSVSPFGPRDAGIPMSLDEFEAAEFKEGYRYELIHGVLLVTPSPLEEERDANEELGHWLRNYRESQRWIGEREVAFLGGPDLVVAVMTPDDGTQDKLSFYESLGVKDVLIIEQETCRPAIRRAGRLFFEHPGEALRSEVTGLEFSQGTDGMLGVPDAASGRFWKV